MAPLIQPVVLYRSTRIAARRHKDVLPALRKGLLAAAPGPEGAPVQVERIRLRTLVTLVAAVFAAYILAVELARTSFGEAFRQADWRWGAVALGAVRADLRRGRVGAVRVRARTAEVRPDLPHPGRLLVRDPGHARRRRRGGAQSPLPAQVEGRVRRRGGQRGRLAGHSVRAAPHPAGDLHRARGHVARTPRYARRDGPTSRWPSWSAWPWWCWPCRPAASCCCPA